MGSSSPAWPGCTPAIAPPRPQSVFQGVWAILLTLTGRYGDLLDYVVFGDWIFFAAVAVDGLRLPVRGSGSGGRALQLRFRMPGFPLLPIAFMLAALYVVAGLDRVQPGERHEGDGADARWACRCFCLLGRERSGKGVSSL